jgi:hypothetical protein
LHHPSQLNEPVLNQQGDINRDFAGAEKEIIREREKNASRIMAGQG